MKNSNGNILFSSSGCLSAEALERYAHGTLESDDIRKAEHHLQSCPLCVEALDGYKMMDSEDFRADHQWLDQKMDDFLVKAGDGSNNPVQNDLSPAGRPSVRSIKPFYMRMIAAMLLLLVSVGGWFVLQYYANDWRAKQTASLSESIDPIAWPEDEVSMEITTVPIYQEIILNPPEPPAEIQVVPQMEENSAYFPSKNKTIRTPATHAPANDRNQQLMQKATMEPVLPDDVPQLIEDEAAVAEEETEVFVVVEQMPQFPGGEKKLLQYLKEAVVYPEKAKKNAVEGTVFVSFVVEPDGLVDQVKILRGIGSGCDEAAAKAVELMPPWTPGFQRGKAVRVIMNLPIRFSIH